MMAVGKSFACWVSVLALVAWLPAFGGDKPHVLMMIGEREYLTRETLPKFAKEELESRGFRVTVVQAAAEDPNHFPGLEALEDADILLLSVRRRTLSSGQMALVKQHFEAGKGLVGIRTASHAFALRNKPAPAGHVQWPDFDTEVLGHKYGGHFKNTDGTEVEPKKDAKGDPLLQEVGDGFHSGGTLYIASELAPGTKVLLTGSCVEKEEAKSEPVAFRRNWKNCRVFYTSLGHPLDFKQPGFRSLLVNAVRWAAEKGEEKQ